MSDGSRSPVPCPARRRFLAAGGALVLGGACAPSFAADTPPERLPPQAGDLLAFPSYEEDGRLLRATDLEVDAAPLLVYPHDAARGLTRERSRLNQILVVRVAPTRLDDATRGHAAEGVVAYSALCTHTACAIDGWDATRGHFVCPCHQSEFDATRRGTRVAGPAPRALPLLPLQASGEHYAIVAGFTSRVGANQT